jgi:hypothetical protein
MFSPRSIDYWYYQVQIIHLLPLGNVYIFTKSIFSSKIIDFSSKIPRRKNVVNMDKLTTIRNYQQYHTSVTTAIARTDDWR